MISASPDTFPSLFAGYAVIWSLIVGYLLVVNRRLSRIEKTLLTTTKDGAKAHDSKQ